jgi:protein SCO1/2
MEPEIQDSRFKMQDGREEPSAGRRRLRRLCILHFAFCMAIGSGVAHAQQQPGMPGSMGHQTGIVASNVPPQFKEITFQQRLNQRLPLDATFKDETGRTVKLGDYFGTKPIVLAFVYFQCPMLCSQTLNGIAMANKVLPFTPGNEFDIVLVSFDPRDTPEAANAKKRAHLQHWAQTDSADGWHFLTGDEATIRRVTDAAGFTYKWDEASGQYAHVSGLLTLTPDGRLSRYFYGVEYSPKELRLALVESGEGRIGTAVEELLLYCFQYDPTSGRYGVVVMNLVRLGGLVTMALVGGFVVMMRRRESRAPVERHA